MPKDNNSFRLRFQYYKQTGKLPYKAGRVNEELATDAILSRLMPIELQQDPLGMLKRLDIARANAANVTAMLNQAQIGTDTRTRSEIQRGNRQAAVDRLVQREALQKLKNEEAFGNLINAATRVVSPSTYVEKVIGEPLTGAAALATDVLTFGAAGALKSGVRAAARGVKNWRPTVPYTPKISPATVNLTKPENSIINSLFEEASIPYEELQMFKNSVLERMADARGITDPVLRKNFILDGMSKVGTKYNRSSILSNPLAEGTTDSTTGTITIKPGSEEFALGHEMRHRLDYVRCWNGSENFTLTPEEYGTLRKAYTAEFLDYPAEYPMQVEMVTTNADVRKQLLGKLALRDLSVAEQNAKIDAATGTEVLNALKNANDYGNYYYRALMTNPIYRENNAQLMINILRNIKAATKYVGAFGVPTALSVPLLNNTNNEK